MVRTVAQQAAVAAERLGMNGRAENLVTHRQLRLPQLPGDRLESPRTSSMVLLRAGLPAGRFANL